MLLKEPISPLFAYTNRRPCLTERKRIFFYSPWAKDYMRDEKRCVTCASKQLHKIFNAYCEICFHEIAFYSLLLLCKECHIMFQTFSFWERAGKKSSRIYDKLMYTDSKQSKKWHWEILKLFQSSILNAQISLKLKCFAWVTITLCRCSGQGYKRITSGMDMNFFIHLTPLKPNASRNKNFEAQNS